MMKKYFNYKKATMLLALSLATTSFGQDVTTFDYTGGEQTFVVPAGVTEIQFDVLGAEGGDIEGTTIGWGGTSDIFVDAGNGGQVTGLLTVTPGETLYLYVGGEGSEASGGYNGGGDPETCSGTEVIAAGGGGASDIRQGGATLANRVAVAGAGGGVAGNGGGPYKSTAGSGAGGGLTAQMALTETGSGPCTRGGAGSAVSGGVGGNNSCWCSGGLVGGSGTLGFGGSSLCAPSGLSTCSCGGTGCTSGGGGGGGYYGGGAGVCFAGGGGGSSYADPGATDVEHTQGVREGHGQIIITILCTAITVTASDTEICFGETVTLDGEGEGTITWDMGIEDDVEFEPLTTGIITYTATSDDPTDCDISIDIEVFELPEVTISSDETEICEGATVILNSGGDADTYEWDPADVTEGDAYSPDLGVTTFTVTGTNDITGCENEASIEILVNALPDVTATVDDDKICLGQGFTATGTGATDYSWLPVDILDGVEYVPTEIGTIYLLVTGTDDNDCINEAEIEVEVRDSIQIDYVATDEIFGDDGEIAIDVTGGYTPYTYDWDNDGTGDFDDTEDLTGLAAGTYILVVEDAEGCSNTLTAVVGSQVGIDELNGSSLAVYPNPTVNEITIALAGNFSYELVTVTGDIILNGVATDQETITLASLANGTYFVKIKQEETTKTIQIVKQ
ncbi:MAG: T9SS type A sorting domain-containing protein [Crocinitomix sp.]|nr:T9SS type A sorting domain-containing protein [Crocinitomix sp.]